MYRIAIVDDDQDTVAQIIEHISRNECPFEITGTAEDRNAALELVRATSPDLLLISICMPRMDGFAFLQQTIKENPSLKAIVFGTSDAYSYVRKALRIGAVDYLTKPVSWEDWDATTCRLIKEMDHQTHLQDSYNTLCAQFEDNRDLLQKKFLEQLLQGRIPLEGISVTASRLGLDLEGNHYAVAMFRLQPHSAFGNLDSAELRFNSIALHFTGLIHMHPCTVQNGVVAILLISHCKSFHQFLDKLEQGIESFCNQVRTAYQQRIYCALGQLVTNPTQIHQSYRQALLLSRTTLQADAQLVKYQDLMISIAPYEAAPLRPDDLESRLLLQIQMGRKEQALDALEDILRYYALISRAGQEQFTLLALVELIFSISTSMQKLGIHILLWQDEQMIVYLQQHFTMGGLLDTQAVMRDYIAKCCAQVLTNNANHGERIVFNLKELIEQNLSNEKFNLETASSMLYFSSNYIRQIFKKITGESFMEYLIRRRMEMASGLLKEDHKIQEVAAKTGYSNQRYFASSFKKYFGCTPSEYKVQYGMERKITGHAHSMSIPP